VSHHLGIVGGMGFHAKGLVIYGYDLGAEGRGVREAEESENNPYGYIKTAWYDEEAGNDEDEEEGLGFTERIELALYAAIPGAPALDYPSACQTPVRDHYGVWLEDYCHYENAHWALAAFSLKVTGSRPELLDLPALQAQAVEENWAGKLAAALTLLGLTPIQDRPGWILAADYG
jgi:hypothetical protein